MREKALALISGLFFGLGLGISQMIDRARVLGFLDIAGEWDPTLAFVMGGAVSVTIISFRFVLKRPSPVFEAAFYLPTRKEIDPNLLIGAGLFGIGWGIAGYCPGPALTATVLGIANPLIFIAAMIVGFRGFEALSPMLTNQFQRPLNRD
ncbi:MAG: YeeE/YedE family protein [Leptolyngbya sp. SIO1E4]|nr:YeeE/YedE family protein [Leptolyngbya sp. SIO1E4]